MKIISVGDIHGRPYWKEIDPVKYDKIIFVGDYCDSYVYTDTEIETNLLDIIQLKKNNFDKVVLLLGNHDIHYKFLSEGFQGSGFRPSMAINLNMIFKHSKDLFQVAYQIDNYIWSHAGISYGWYENNKKEIQDVAERFDTKNLADTFNHMMQLNENRLLHQVGKKRGGRYSFGGITWADRYETMSQFIDGYHQIVGHTPINIITKFGDEKGSIRYIDILGEVDYHLYKEMEAQKKWGANTEYDKQIRALFPDLQPEPVKTELNLITKFYEFEIEHLLQ